MKRHFQLLEVMVAVFILLICAAPAMRIFTNTYKGQLGIVRSNERDHLVHLIFANIVEQLYKKAIPLDVITGEETTQISVDDPELQKQLAKWGYTATYVFSLTSSTTSKADGKPQSYLLKLDITMHDEKFDLKKTDLIHKTPDTVYTYEIYVDSGALRDKGGNDKDPKLNESYVDKKETDKNQPGDKTKENTKAGKFIEASSKPASKPTSNSSFRKPK